MKIKHFDIIQQGISIKCKLYQGEARACSNIILSCHGFGGDKNNSATEKLAETLLPVHKDTAVLAFDWPCHGSDVKQKLDLQDCTRYIRTICDYAERTLGAEKLFCFGTSFGGYLILKYIYEYGSPFDRILLRCPAVDMYKILTEKVITPEQAQQLRKKDVPVGFDQKVKVSAAFLTQLQENDITSWDYSGLTRNLLILHGTKDELVSHQVVEAFAEKNGIDFISIENGDHRFREPSKIREVIDYTMEHFFGM